MKICKFYIFLVLGKSFCQIWIRLMEDNLDEEFMDPSDEEEDSDDQSDVEKDDLDNFGKDVSDLKKRLVFTFFTECFMFVFQAETL